ncbi:D-ribose ABC transporter substrate-binding protein [Paenibacillus naphthalenovorans]|uniref:D-ribose ABC transporter substrate-binding protein n=1 Tax=Paenibacillus naphthalenovorans TaxID=162209 RepID=UPI00088FE172|nr:D-ribose ABC transporter substrate-binding protein [Paenibacillus naphthalenovorans]SDI42267.1 ribose transport system substrate-binding protein [Paenibacillus naphthalenovorans]
MKNGFTTMLILLLVFLTACSGSAPSGSNGSATNQPPTPAPQGGGTADKKLVIGTSVPSLEFTFFVAAQKSWQETAKELGVEAPFYNAENNQAKQNRDVEDMIVKKVNAIVLIPITTEGVTPAIKAANEAGIPVFTVDRSVTSKDAKVVAHIGTNHEDMGENAAKLFLKGLEEKYPNEPVWNVAELQGTPGSSAAIERGKGIHNILENNPKVKIVASLNGEFQSTTAMRAAENILTANKTLHGFIAHNDMMIEGAWQAAKAANRDTQLIMVGMDGQKSTVEKIKSGEIYGSALQYPSMLGDGLKTAVKHLNQEKVEEQVWVPTDLIDQANADDMLKTKAW